MSDVNTFIDAIGHDVNAAVAPRVQDLADQIRDKTLADYGPRVSTFASQLIKDIIDEQSGTVREFVTAVIQDLSQRYRPELAGELHANIMNGCVQADWPWHTAGSEASRHRRARRISGHSGVAADQGRRADREIAEHADQVRCRALTHSLGASNRSNSARSPVLLR